MELNEIRNADDSVTGLNQGSIALGVFQNVPGTTVVLISVKFNDETELLTSIVGSEVPIDAWNSGVGDDLRIEPIAQKTA